MSRRSFAAAFPRVAALLATVRSTTAPADRGTGGEDDEDAGTRDADRGTGGQVDMAALQTAFEADADKMVDAERKRWAAVLESDEGQANIVGATTLLSDTDMDADKVKATLKKMGPAAKVAPKGGAADEDDDDGERQPARGAAGIGKARERLRGSADVDKDTGGGGAGGKDGKDGTRSGPADEAGRERRASMRDKRNAAAQRGGGRGARDNRQTAAAR